EKKREYGPLPKLPGDVSGECGPLPKMPVGAHRNAGLPAPNLPEGAVHQPDAESVENQRVVDPTVPWAHPCFSVPAASHDGVQTSVQVPVDVGICSIVGGVADVWGSADSLLGLDSNQFLNLLVPCIADSQQLTSLRGRFIRSTDRMQLLGKHQDLWADDEIRFHLHLIQQAFQGKPKGDGGHGLIIVDPLVSAAWIQNRAFACEQWAAAHPEVCSQAIQVIMVVRVEQHWIPVHFVPNGRHVNVFTWDAPENSHDVLNGMIEKLAFPWGFGTFLIHRQQRMFFSSRLCGALAVHYVRHVLFGTQLPATQNEAMDSHNWLREKFVECLSQHTQVMRPWIWGQGDDEATEKSWPSHDSSPANTGGAAASSAAPPRVYDSNRVLSSHMCISLDDRLDLMAQHGRDMADDEIRFHLNVLVDRYNEQRLTANRFRPFFMAFDCLNFWNWDETGHVLTEKWCVSFPQVRSEGQQVVTVMLIDDHWIPFWLVPGGRVLVAHTFNDWLDWDIVEGRIRWMGLHLGFEEVVIHRIPQGLPDHRLCGSQALSFLAHVLLQADLPQDLRGLEDMFTAQRASFVQEMYADSVCRCPVIWGAGGSGVLIKSLSEELLRHGPFPWPKPWEISPDAWTSLPGDPSEKYAALWNMVEKAASDALPFCPGKQVKGRAQTIAPKTRRVGRCPPLKVSIEELKWRMEYAWLRVVSSRVAHRPGLADLGRADPKKTRKTKWFIKVVKEVMRHMQLPFAELLLEEKSASLIKRCQAEGRYFPEFLLDFKLTGTLEGSDHVTISQQCPER
ncbi:unnamed protein product, partial [Cladocopium goreaui]